MKQLDDDIWELLSGKDLNMKKVNTFEEYLNDEERVSREDREAVLLEADLISKLIEARKKSGLSKREPASKAV